MVARKGTDDGEGGGVQQEGESSSLEDRLKSGLQLVDKLSGDGTGPSEANGGSDDGFR
jgi:hypothetical protein